MLSFLSSKDSSSSPARKIAFEHLEEVHDIARLLEAEQPVFVYKHSTRCSVSLFAMRRLNSVEPQPRERWVYLDVIKQRSLSHALSEELGVRHESPQLLLLQSGKVLAHCSHNQVNEDTVEAWRKEYITAEQV